MKVMVIETGKGTIVCDLRNRRERRSDGTIANFENKANAGDFDGRIFHRVENWVIQGGDPLAQALAAGKIPAEYNKAHFSAGRAGRGTGPRTSRATTTASSLSPRATRVGSMANTPTSARL